MNGVAPYVLSNNMQASILTTLQNTVNVLSPIFKILVPNRVDVILENGLPWKMRLFDGTATEIPANSKFVLALLHPGKDFNPVTLWDMEYSVWEQLADADQNDSLKNDEIRTRFPDPRGVRAPQNFTLVGQLQSSAQVDWTKGSKFNFRAGKRLYAYA